MRKNIPLLTTLFIACFLFLKCEKEVEYPRKFILDSYSAGQLKLFTNSGEVTDPERINGFISGFENYFWMNPDTLSYDSWDVQIELLSETRARMIVDTDSIIDFNVTRKNGILYLEYHDTLMSMENLIDSRLKYHPIYMVTLPSYMGGQTNAFIPCIYAIENEDQLYIPMVSYMENIYYESGMIMASQGIGNYNNEFNTGYLNSLSLMPLIDTILFQNNYVLFSLF